MTCKILKKVCLHSSTSYVELEMTCNIAGIKLNFIIRNVPLLSVYCVLYTSNDSFLPLTLRLV